MRLWRRRERDTAAARTGAMQGAPVPPVPAAPVDQWRQTGPMPTVIRPRPPASDFRGTLASWRSAGLMTGIGHGVTADAPAGTMRGVTRSTPPSGEDLVPVHRLRSVSTSDHVSTSDSAAAVEQSRPVRATQATGSRPAEIRRSTAGYADQPQSPPVAESPVVRRTPPMSPTPPGPRTSNGRASDDRVSGSQSPGKQTSGGESAAIQRVVRPDRRPVVSPSTSPGSEAPINRADSVRQDTHSPEATPPVAQRTPLAGTTSESPAAPMDSHPVIGDSDTEQPPVAPSAPSHDAVDQPVVRPISSVEQAAIQRAATPEQQGSRRQAAPHRTVTSVDGAPAVQRAPRPSSPESRGAPAEMIPAIPEHPVVSIESPDARQAIQRDADVERPVLSTPPSTTAPAIHQVARPNRAIQNTSRPSAPADSPRPVVSSTRQPDSGSPAPLRPSSSAPRSALPDVRRDSSPAGPEPVERPPLRGFDRPAVEPTEQPDISASSTSHGLVQRATESEQDSSARPVVRVQRSRQGLGEPLSELPATATAPPRGDVGPFARMAIPNAPGSQPTGRTTRQIWVPALPPSTSVRPTPDEPPRTPSTAPVQRAVESPAPTTPNLHTTNTPTQGTTTPLVRTTSSTAVSIPDTQVRKPPLSADTTPHTPVHQTGASLQRAANTAAPPDMPLQAVTTSPPAVEAWMRPDQDMPMHPVSTVTRLLGDAPTHSTPGTTQAADTPVRMAASTQRRTTPDMPVPSSRQPGSPSSEPPARVAPEAPQALPPVGMIQRSIRPMSTGEVPAQRTTQSTVVRPVHRRPRHTPLVPHINPPAAPGIPSTQDGLTIRPLPDRSAGRQAPVQRTPPHPGAFMPFTAADLPHNPPERGNLRSVSDKDGKNAKDEKSEPEPEPPTPQHIDELARRLFDPLSRMLRADLRQSRDRAGRPYDR